MHLHTVRQSSLVFLKTPRFGAYCSKRTALLVIEAKKDNPHIHQSRNGQNLWCIATILGSSNASEGPRTCRQCQREEDDLGYSSKINVVMSVPVWCGINHPWSAHNARWLLLCWTCTWISAIASHDQGGWRFFIAKSRNCGPLRHTDVFWSH